MGPRLETASTGGVRKSYFTGFLRLENPKINYLLTYRFLGMFCDSMNSVFMRVSGVFSSELNIFTVLLTSLPHQIIGKTVKGVFHENPSQSGSTPVSRVAEITNSLPSP